MAAWHRPPFLQVHWRSQPEPNQPGAQPMGGRRAMLRAVARAGHPRGAPQTQIPSSRCCLSIPEALATTRPWRGLRSCPGLVAPCTARAHVWPEKQCEPLWIWMWLLVVLP